MAEIREVIARGFHEHLSRRDVMQYLDNEEDCDGLADAALAAIKEAGFVVVPAEPDFDTTMSGARAIAETIAKLSAPEDPQTVIDNLAEYFSSLCMPEARAAYRAMTAPAND